jgi:hypothetical protein
MMATYPPVKDLYLVGTYPGFTNINICIYFTSFRLLLNSIRQLIFRP